MSLGREDFITATWQRLEQRLHARREQLRDQLERPQIDEITSAILRGRIAEIKELLALAKPTPAHAAGPERHLHPFD